VFYVHKFKQSRIYKIVFNTDVVLLSITDTSVTNILLDIQRSVHRDIFL
jgi:hypothetical protein